MRGTRVFLATLACVAFLGASAGTAAADGYHKCEVTVVGVCDGGKVNVYDPVKGILCLENGDTFWANPYYGVNWQAKVGKFCGPWLCDKIIKRDGKCFLDVSRGFCRFKIVGVPDRFIARIHIWGIEGDFRDGDAVCLPMYVYFRYQARVREVHGPWLDAKVCCNDLDVAKDFCLFTVKGIPTGCNGVVDIKDLAPDFKNGDTFYAPNKGVICARARVPDVKGFDGIPGPWFQVWVCCNGDLDVCKRFVEVTFKSAWTDVLTQTTHIRDLNIALGNGKSLCLPTCAKVYIRPNVSNFTNWVCKVFYQDTTVIWKVICVTK
jgi:hypothetical protein